MVYLLCAILRGESSSSENYYLEAEENGDIVCCDGSHVYTLRSPMHIVCLILNILLPGWGTVLSACVCMHAVRDPRRICNCSTITDGII